MLMFNVCIYIYVTYPTIYHCIYIYIYIYIPITKLPESISIPIKSQHGCWLNPNKTMHYLDQRGSGKPKHLKVLMGIPNAMLTSIGDGASKAAITINHKKVTRLVTTLSHMIPRTYSSKSMLDFFHGYKSSSRNRMLGNILSLVNQYMPAQEIFKICDFINTISCVDLFRDI